MSGIINLRTARKRKAREDARREADAKAAKHGLTKGERRRIETERAGAEAHLDRHKRETED